MVKRDTGWSSFFIPGLLSVAFMALTAFSASASAITYKVDRQIGTGSVTGFIETDGTIGVLSAANFVDWNLTLSDGKSTYQLKGPLSGNNSSIFLQGTDVAAFNSFLFFNFSGIDFGTLLFRQDPVAGSRYYCDSTQPFLCPAGETVAPSNNPADLRNTTPKGNQVIGVRVDETPEPGTGALLTCGISALLARCTGRFWRE